VEVPTDITMSGEFVARDRHDEEVRPEVSGFIPSYLEK
jgi:hypothetical protein